MTYTYTYAKIDSTTRDTVRANGDLARVATKPQEADGFFLPSGHYKVEGAYSTQKVEGPVWILFDNEGYPYSLTPDEFEKGWEVKDG